jgi:hypothetical protein
MVQEQLKIASLGQLSSSSSRKFHNQMCRLHRVITTSNTLVGRNNRALVIVPPNPQGAIFTRGSTRIWDTQ